MRKVLLNAVGKFRAGDVFDPDQGQQQLIDAALSIGGAMVDESQSVLDAAMAASSAYLRGDAAAATGIMLGLVGGHPGPPGPTGDPTVIAPVSVDLPTDGLPSSTELTLTEASLISIVVARLSVAMTGAGSVELKVGSTEGGDEVLLAQAIDDSVPAGTVYGQDTSQVGGDFVADTGYTKTYPAGTTLYVTLTPTGEVTGGSLKFFLTGAVLT